MRAVSPQRRPGRRQPPPSVRCLGERIDGRAIDLATCWEALAPIGLVVIVPLVFQPGAFAPFHAAKLLAVWFLVPAGLAVCAATGTLRWPRWTWFLPLIFVSVVATVLGVAPWMSLVGSPNRNNGLLAMFLAIGSFVLGASVAADAVVQRRVLRAAFVTGGVVGVLAVAERLGLDIASVGDAGEITRARSTWGSATFAAAYFVVVLPIAVAHLRSRDGRWRAAGAVCSATILAGLLAHRHPRGLARGARVRLGDGAGLVRHERSATPRQTRARRWWPWSPPSPRWASLRLTVGGSAARPGQRGRPSGPVVDHAVGDRRTADPWQWARHAAFGAPRRDRRGLRTRPRERGAARPGPLPSAGHARRRPESWDWQRSWWLLVVLARDVAVNLRRELVPTAIAAGLAGYLVTLLFAFGDPVIDPIPWMLAGLLWVAIVPSAGGSSSAPTTQRPPPRWRTAAAISLACVAVAGLVVAGGEVVAEARLDAALGGQPAGDLSSALDELESAMSVAPARFDLRQAYSRIVRRSLTDGREIAETTPLCPS